MNCPEIGDRFCDTRASPIEYLFCTKRTKTENEVFIWANSIFVPLEFCRIVRIDPVDVLAWCNACTMPEQGQAIARALARMRLTPTEKAFWGQLSPQKKQLLKGRHAQKLPN